MFAPPPHPRQVDHGGQVVKTLKRLLAVTGRATDHAVFVECLLDALLGYREPYSLAQAAERRAITFVTFQLRLCSYNAALIMLYTKQPRPLIRSSRQSKETGLHVDLTQLGHTSRKLEICLDALENPHMRKANLLDEFEFGVFGEGRNTLRYPEHGADNVVA